ncbi:DUF6442 family protein [Fontibacillus sp. BL9]|uniref:DUF6442 family protein n=1 Tax=Fontibacillus sp. BL9 TaxID=3389971 RepID=UPI003979F072
MKREEILEKSRQENRDEGKEFVFNKGRKSGVIGMLVMFCVLAIFNMYNTLQEANYALIALMFGYLGSEGLGMYSITKKKMDLFKFIIGCVVSVSFLVVYIYGVSK